MNKKYYIKLVSEAKKIFATATPEQKVRIFEKLSKLKEKVETKNHKVVFESSDFLEEK